MTVVARFFEAQQTLRTAISQAVAQRLPDATLCTNGKRLAWLTRPMSGWYPIHVATTKRAAA